jgi:hypothetical protein
LLRDGFIKRKSKRNIAKFVSIKTIKTIKGTKDCHDGENHKRDGAGNGWDGAFGGSSFKEGRQFLEGRVADSLVGFQKEPSCLASGI